MMVYGMAPLPVSVLYDLRDGGAFHDLQRHADTVNRFSALVEFFLVDDGGRDGPRRTFTV